MKKINGLSDVAAAVDRLALSERNTSRMDFVVALGQLLESFSGDDVSKAFHWLFWSRGVWERAKRFFTKETPPPDRSRKSYLSYILGPGYDWFLEEHDREYSKEQGYASLHWSIYRKAKTEKQRVVVLYHAIDIIGKGEYEENGFEAACVLMGISTDKELIFSWYQ